MSLKKPEYRRMYATMRQSSGPMFMKSVLTVFFVYLLKAFLIAFALSPFLGNYADIIMDFMTGQGSGSGFFTKENLQAFSAVTPTLGSVIVSMILIFTACVLSDVFSYGTNVYFSKISLTGKSRFADVFSGFSERTGRVWFAALFKTAVNFIIVFVLFLLSLLIIRSVRNPVISAAENENQLFVFSTIITVSLLLVMAFFLLFAKLTFVFTSNMIQQYKEASFFTCIKRAVVLIHGRYLHYLFFVIYINIKNIIVIVVINLFFALIPEKFMSAVAFLSFIFNFILFMQQYTVILKGKMAVPIYCFSLMSINGGNLDGMLNEDPS